MRCTPWSNFSLPSLSKLARAVPFSFFFPLDLRVELCAECASTKHQVLLTVIYHPFFNFDTMISLYMDGLIVETRLPYG